ncbi:hypothetical protein AMTR_s00030p00243340 [Amborella trichopoda]|uniref:Secreted protein n=1 Tax=Amborella trichopoda TaxID=13333 RepID=U5CSH9_AMBTC|nr:hypothetical protein AMTR_s00030p00243340 [Amborella trichopoda]
MRFILFSPLLTQITLSFLSCSVVGKGWMFNPRGGGGGLRRGGGLTLRPTFVLARHVGIAVKLPSAFALAGQSPSGSKKPLHASITFWEAYAP